jgi:alpha-L-arabinofuranosidase
MKSMTVRLSLAATGLAWLGGSSSAQTNQTIYSDSLVNGWGNWSWAANSNTTQMAHSGTRSLAVTVGRFQAAYFHHDALDANHFTNLTFWLNGGAAGGQQLEVKATLSGKAQRGVPVAPPAKETWQPVTISLKDLEVAGKPDFDGVWFADRTGDLSPPSTSMT